MPCLVSFLVVLSTIGPIQPPATETDPAPPGLAIAVDHRLYPRPQGFQRQPLGQPVPQESRSSPRLRRGVLGGLIGAVAGVATCTLISNAFFNEGGGMSTCTTKGNTTFAVGGFALGFAIGWLTGDSHD
jgi:hypothetical protein